LKNAKIYEAQAKEKKFKPYAVPKEKN